MIALLTISPANTRDTKIKKSFTINQLPYHIGLQILPQRLCNSRNETQSRHAWSHRVQNQPPSTNLARFNLSASALTHTRSPIHFFPFICSNRVNILLKIHHNKQRIKEEQEVIIYVGESELYPVRTMAMTGGRGAMRASINLLNRKRGRNVGWYMVGFCPNQDRSLLVPFFSM